MGARERQGAWEAGLASASDICLCDSDSCTICLSAGLLGREGGQCMAPASEGPPTPSPPTLLPKDLPSRPADRQMVQLSASWKGVINTHACTHHPHQGVCRSFKKEAKYKGGWR